MANANVFAMEDQILTIVDIVRLPILERHGETSIRELAQSYNSSDPRLQLPSVTLKSDVSELHGS